MTVEESRLGGGVDGRCREPHPCFRTHSPPPRVFAVSLISAMASVVFLFVLVSVFAAGAHASSEEPNIPDSCALLEPVHNESTPLASSFPGAITIAMDTDIYELGATVESELCSCDIPYSVLKIVEGFSSDPFHLFSLSLSLCPLQLQSVEEGARPRSAVSLSRLVKPGSL